LGSTGRIGRKSSISRLRGKQGNYLAKKIDKITLGSTSPFEGGKRGMTDLQIFIIRLRLIFSTKSPKTTLIAEESNISSPFVPLPRGKQGNYLAKKIDKITLGLTSPFEGGIKGII
jgi:CDP-diacylglycerol pyrophosphatase